MCSYFFIFYFFYKAKTTQLLAICACMECERAVNLSDKEIVEMSGMDTIVVVVVVVVVIMIIMIIIIIIIIIITTYCQSVTTHAFNST